MQVKWVSTYDLPFCIECKHYKKFDPFNLLIRKRNSPELKAWEQAVENASKSDGKSPLLIFKANNKPIYVAFDVFSYFEKNAKIYGFMLEPNAVTGHEGIHIIDYTQFLLSLVEHKG